MAKHSSFKFLWVSKWRVLFTPAECVSAYWDSRNQSRITLKSHSRHQTSMWVIYVPRRCFILCMRILWYYITCLLETIHSRIALLNRIFLLNSLNWLQKTERTICSKRTESGRVILESTDSLNQELSLSDMSILQQAKNRADSVSILSLPKIWLMGRYIITRVAYLQNYYK